MRNNVRSWRLYAVIAAAPLIAMLSAPIGAQEPKPRPAATAQESQSARPERAASHAPSSKLTASQKTARYFDSIKNDPVSLLAFLKAMPKGADLHNHLSGAVYAEDFIKLAIANHLCVIQNSLAPPPCPGGQSIDQALALNPALYDKLIDSWSMRNWQLSGESGHDHFFAAFGKFGAAITDSTLGDMLASALNQAAIDRVSYVEFMFTPNSGNIRKIALGRWNNDFDVMTRAMTDAGLSAEVEAGLDLAKHVTADARKRLSCGGPNAQPGCAVEMHFLFQGQRASPREQAFALFLAGFQMATHRDNRNPDTGEPLVVGLNLVQPEDSPIAIDDFHLQMSMLHHLHGKYPSVHIALHAGELAPGLVPPGELGFHIRESVERGHAERIGHGVDIMSEDRPYELLKELASRNIPIEICLSSNDLILGVRGPQHPLSAFIKNNVPVMLATDDEGVARSSMTNEYLKAAEEQGLDYLQLKTMARAGLQYAFADGKGLWSDASRFTRVDQCRTSTPSAVSRECSGFLKANKKARLQWRLERDLEEFESAVSREPALTRDKPSTQKVH